MTPIALVDMLVDFLKNRVSEFCLGTNVPGAEPKAPQVIAGYLPEKKPNEKQDPPDIPHVIVRYLEDDNEEEGELAKVRVITATYSKEETHGWRDTLNMATRIKMEVEKREFFGAYQVLSIKRELPEEQPFPVWIALLTITLRAPQVVQEGIWNGE